MLDGCGDLSLRAGGAVDQGQTKHTALLLEQRAQGGWLTLPGLPVSCQEQPVSSCALPCLWGQHRKSVRVGVCGYRWLLYIVYAVGVYWSVNVLILDIHFRKLMLCCVFVGCCRFRCWMWSILDGNMYSFSTERQRLTSTTGRESHSNRSE